MNAFHEAPWTVRIRDSSGRVQGAGFLVGPDVACTCAHVVQDVLGLEEADGRVPKEPVTVELMITGERRTGRVVAWVPRKEQVDQITPENLKNNGFREDLQGPRELDGDDIAILRLEEPYKGSETVKLHPPRNISGHSYRTFGFPEGYDVGLSSQGTFQSADSRGRIQMNVGTQEEPITHGYSGAAVWDKDLGAVVGMVAESDQRLIAKMIPSHQIIDRIRWIDASYEDGQAQVEPLVFAGEQHKNKRSLANAIRLNWFAAKRQFFETHNAFMSETEGWRLLVEWLRQYDTPESDAGEEVRELVDGRLRTAIDPDFKVFFLLAWLDPHGDPVWRGRRVTYDYLCELVLPPLPDDVNSVEAFLRGGLANVERLITWLWIDTPIFWEALARFDGFGDARRHYQSWVRERRDWNAWWEKSPASHGLAIFSWFGHRIFSEAILLNAVLPTAPGEKDTRIWRMSRYAHPGSEPGIIQWYDDFMRNSQELSPPWWLGVTVLSRYAWEQELTAGLNSIKAFGRASIWTGLHAAVLAIICVVVGGVLAVVSGGQMVFGTTLTISICAEIAAVFILGRRAYELGGRYRPPFNDRNRLIASFTERPARSIAKLTAGALTVLLLQAPFLAFVVAVGSTIWFARSASTWSEFYDQVHQAHHAKFRRDMAERLITTRDFVPPQ